MVRAWSTGDAEMMLIERMLTPYVFVIWLACWTAVPILEMS